MRRLLSVLVLAACGSVASGDDVTIRVREDKPGLIRAWMAKRQQPKAALMVAPVAPGANVAALPLIVVPTGQEKPADAGKRLKITVEKK